MRYNVHCTMEMFTRLAHHGESHCDLPVERLYQKALPVLEDLSNSHPRCGPCPLASKTREFDEVVWVAPWSMTSSVRGGTMCSWMGITVRSDPRLGLLDLSCCREARDDNITW